MELSKTDQMPVPAPVSIPASAETCLPSLPEEYSESSSSLPANPVAIQKEHFPLGHECNAILSPSNLPTVPTGPCHLSSSSSISQHPNEHSEEHPEEHSEQDSESDDSNAIKPSYYFQNGGVPVFTPTFEQFKDFKSFVKSIEHYGLISGIVKIIPPREWSLCLEQQQQQSQSSGGMQQQQDTSTQQEDTTATSTSTASTSSFLKRLQAVTIKHPISQNLMRGGLPAGSFRQVNMELRKSFSVQSWYEASLSSAYRAPTLDEDGKVIHLYSSPKRKKASSYSSSNNNNNNNTTLNRTTTNTTNANTKMDLKRHTESISTTEPYINNENTMIHNNSAQHEMSIKSLVSPLNQELINTMNQLHTETTGMENNTKTTMMIVDDQKNLANYSMNEKDISGGNGMEEEKFNLSSCDGDMVQIQSNVPQVVVTLNDMNVVESSFLEGNHSVDGMNCDSSVGEVSFNNLDMMETESNSTNTNTIRIESNITKTTKNNSKSTTIKRKRSIKHDLSSTCSNDGIISSGGGGNEPTGIQFRFKDVSEGYTIQKCQELERFYWKNVTYASPLYGADLLGTLFGKDEDVDGDGNKKNENHWNLNRLDNILNTFIKDDLPGVNRPYLYFGMWKATFAWHVEDMAPKQWYVIPTEQASKFERVARGIFFEEANTCSEFLRHKTCLISPTALANHGITVNKLIQFAGEFVITFPFGYHSGYNLGFNCAESVNFAFESWIEIGKKAKYCKCIKDSVHIDVKALFDPDNDDTQHCDEDEGEYNELDQDVFEEEIEEILPKRCKLCPSLEYEENLVRGEKEGEWAHRICAEFVPETWIEYDDEDPDYEVVIGLDQIPISRWRLKCQFCKKEYPKAKAADLGACIQCASGKCTRSYHVSCAYDKGITLTEDFFCYCPSHDGRPRKLKGENHDGDNESEDEQQNDE